MAESDRPVDMSAWAAYASGGRQRFDVVRRSFSIFIHNANELVELLHTVETNAAYAFRLMRDPRDPDSDDDTRAFHAEFWDELDQRLQNVIAAAISLVDHTRPLIRFYEPHRAFVGGFLDDWEERRVRVRDSREGKFLGRLRNYLLHCGPAPLAHSINLGEITAASPDHVTLRLSADGLLRAKGEWNADHKEFIKSFSGGPPIRRVIVTYVSNMDEIYRWLLDQHAFLHVPGVVPAHLQ